jgi:TPR repeat protein
MRSVWHFGSVKVLKRTSSRQSSGLSNRPRRVSCVRCAIWLFAFADGVPDAGVAVDHSEAMRLMQQAADGGLANAMCNLADWLRELSDPAALEWYMKGAEAGNIICMRRLGSLHRIGACGLQPDNSKALSWFERAAATGDVDSIAILAVFLQEIGDLVRAVEFYHKAADSGSAAAMFNLAVCYMNGTSVTKSVEKAVELYQRAVELGDHRCDGSIWRLCYAERHGRDEERRESGRVVSARSRSGQRKCDVQSGACAT